MKRYGYHRTSTREQHLDRGIKEITAYCEQNNLELEKIFTDQQTGKNFNRPRYQVLKEDVLRVRWSSIFVIFTPSKISIFDLISYILRAKNIHSEYMTKMLLF